MLKSITKFLQCSALTIALAFLIVPVNLFAHNPLYDYADTPSSRFNPIVGHNPTNRQDERAVGYAEVGCQGDHYDMHVTKDALWPPREVLGTKLVYSYKEIEYDEIGQNLYFMTLDDSCTENCDNLKDHYIKCMETAIFAGGGSFGLSLLKKIPIVGPVFDILSIIAGAVSLGIGLHCQYMKPDEDKCGSLEDD